MTLGWTPWRSVTWFSRPTGTGGAADPEVWASYQFGKIVRHAIHSAGVLLTMPPVSRVPSLDELLVHASWLRRLASQLVTDGASAEDLVQETMVVALERPRRPGVPLAPWLARVLRSRAANLARSSSRRQHREQVAARPEALPSMDELSARAESSRELVTYVLELPAAQREVLLLRYYEDLETESIARLLGVSAGAVRSRLSRGHLLLRQRLDAAYGGDRTAWMSALGPLSIPMSLPVVLPAAVPAAATLSALKFLGGLLVSTTTKIALFGALLAFAGLAAYRLVEPAKPKGPARVVEVSPLTAGSSLDSDSQTVTGSEMDARRSVRSESAYSAALPALEDRVEGRVVDGESGHPVPYLEFAIALPSESRGNAAIEDAERVWTDAEGRFTTERAYSLGELEATVLEAHDWVVHHSVTSGEYRETPPVLRFSHRELGAPVQLETNLGPAFYVRADWPEGVSIEGFAVELQREAKLRLRVDSAVLVDAPLALVRFGHAGRDMRLDREEDLRLVVGSKNGSWAGDAPISWRKTWPLPEVPISFSPTASVTFIVADSERHAPSTVQSLLVAGKVAEEDIDEADAVWNVMSGSGFLSILGGEARPGADPPLRSRCHWVPVGPYTLRVRAEGFADVTLWVDLSQGEQEVDVTVRRDVLATGRITGKLRTESGAPPKDALRVWLRRTDVPANLAPRGRSVEGSTSAGPWQGRFDVEDLAEGEYEVWVRSSTGDGPHLEVEPELWTVRTGDPDIEFLVRDQVEVRRLIVEVVDGKNGAPVEYVRGALLSEGLGGEPDIREAEGGRLEYSTTKPLMGSTLWVAAEGYATTVVPFSGVVGADGAHRMRVALHEGWGAIAFAVELVDGVPLGVWGVHFVSNGRRVATTGENGLCGLDLAGRPVRLTVEAPGYVVDTIQGPLDADGTLLDVPESPFDEVFVAILRREG